MQAGARSGVLAVALVVALALVAGSASARERIRSTVTIGTGEAPSGQEFMKGSVRSPKAKCERRRKVVLYWDAPSKPGGYAPVAEDRTSSSGRWRINAPALEIPPGGYYAKVRPARRGGDTCKGARSASINVVGA